MNEKFFDLKKEKQDRMINGAMKVFAAGGYRGASTDDMVKEAGISKGLWFHYFGSKLGLYTFVVDYAVKYMSMELTASFNSSVTGYFDIYKTTEQIKMLVRKSYPYIPLFLASVMNEKDEEAVKAVHNYIDAYSQKVKKPFENVDDSLWMPGVDKEVLDMTVSFTMLGILKEEYEKDSFDADEYIRRISEYLDMMKALCIKAE